MDVMAAQRSNDPKSGREEIEYGQIILEAE
jgi:hypothetical protein